MTPAAMNRDGVRASISTDNNKILADQHANNFHSTHQIISPAIEPNHTIKSNNSALSINSNHTILIAGNSNNSATTTTTNDWLVLPDMDNFVDIFSICCSTAVIFGGLVPYIPQFLKIKRSMNSDGFSTYVCLTLLIANILRILFWFGHHFELPLLIQSFVMIAGMLMMMEICIRVRDKDSSYVISAIGGHGSNRRRRSLMGKLHHHQQHLQDNELISSTDANDMGDNESRPIYSVLGQSSVSWSSLASTSATTSQITPTDPTISSGPSKIESAVPPLHQSYQSTESHNSSVDSSGKITFAATQSHADGNVSFRTNPPIFNYNSLSQQYQVNSFLLNTGDRSRNFRSLIRFAPIHLFRFDVSDRLMTYVKLTSRLLTKHLHPQSTGCNLNDFWDWDDYSSYIKFLSVFTFIMSLVTYLLIDNYLYVESIGFLAVMIESMLGLPQLLKNFRKKSTRGMSVEMVVMWLSGDLFKTLYFIIRKTPIQFYICGSIQVLVDVLILVQVFWYQRPIVTYRKLPKST